jgi:hypothetical protein
MVESEIMSIIIYAVREFDSIYDAEEVDGIWLLTTIV